MTDILFYAKVLASVALGLIGVLPMGFLVLERWGEWRREWGHYQDLAWNEFVRGVTITTIQACWPIAPWTNQIIGTSYWELPWMAFLWLVAAASLAMVIDSCYSRVRSYRPRNSWVLIDWKKLHDDHRDVRNYGLGVTIAALGISGVLAVCLAVDIAHKPKEAGGKKQITNSIGMKLTLIPAGDFRMGSPESARDTKAFFDQAYGVFFLPPDHLKDEHPDHRVRITRSFRLGTHHVTRGQFRQFVNDTGYKTDAERGEMPGAFGWISERKRFGFSKDYSWRNAGFEQSDEHPAVNVSWNDAVAFCKWLSRKEGKTYRLPTEAEWEYACRAGTSTRYHSGDDPETLAKVGNVADAAFKAKSPDLVTIKANDGYVFTAPVGSLRPNAFGLYDMHGNAWEWCSDRYGAEYYTKCPADDPPGPDTGDERVLRGGSWDSGPVDNRSAARAHRKPDDRDLNTGFRVALIP